MYINNNAYISAIEGDCIKYTLFYFIRQNIKLKL